MTEIKKPVNTKSETSNSETQIIGFRLSKALAHSVKIESAQRKMPLKDLFAEMWELYSASKK